MNTIEDFIDEGEFLIFKANGLVPVRFEDRCTPYNGREDQVELRGEVAGFKPAHSHDLVKTGRAVYFTAKDLEAEIKAKKKALADAEHSQMPVAENRDMTGQTTTKTGRGGKRL